MDLFAELSLRYGDLNRPFMVCGDQTISLAQVFAQELPWLENIKSGDVVAVVGDFDERSLATILHLVNRGAIIVPLVGETRADHEYYLSASYANAVVEMGGYKPLARSNVSHPLIDGLRKSKQPGLILFSSGTTGRPKAILHDFSQFLSCYREPRQALRTLSFLNFDHIGGINTFFQTLYNRGVIIVPSGRTVEAVASDIEKHRVDLLPTSPTFLRSLLFAGDEFLESFKCLKYIVYAAEIMDQATLNKLCLLLPDVSIRQGYGMSEMGIMRIQSQSRDSLWMSINDDSVEWKVDDGILKLKSDRRMLGYLNAEDPFEKAWYNTGDLVEVDREYFKILGRKDDVINVGGLKVLPAEIERVALLHQDVVRASAKAVANSITGQHIEIICELAEESSVDRKVLRRHFQEYLPSHFCPHKIKLGKIEISHRHKQK